MTAKRMPLVAAAVWWLRSARPRVKPLSAHLLVDLVEYCDAEGSCYPGVAALGEDIGADRRSVQRALGELLQHPAAPIARTVRYHHSTPVYRVTQALLSLAEGRHGRRVMGDASRETRQERPAGASLVSRRGVTRVAALKEEPPTYPPTEPPDADAPVAASLILAPGSWPATWSRDLVDCWTTHGGAIAGGRLAKALHPLKDRHAFGDVLRGLAAFLQAGKAGFGPEVFARSAVTWINAPGPEALMSPLTKHNAMALGLVPTKGGSS